MKKTGLILVAAAFAFSANAQKMEEADVPALVISSFQKLYPGVKVKKWEKEKEDYEAEFMKDKTEVCALFNATGNQLETEMEMPVSDLPPAVATYIESHYPKSKIKEASKITTTRGVVTYEADIGKTDLIFDENGKFLNEDKDADKDDEGKDEKK